MRPRKTEREGEEERIRQDNIFFQFLTSQVYWFLLVRITASIQFKTKKERKKSTSAHRNPIQLIGIDEFIQTFDDGSQTYILYSSSQSNFLLSSVNTFSFFSVSLCEVYFHLIRLCITFIVEDWVYICIVWVSVRTLNSQFLGASFSSIWIYSEWRQVRQASLDTRTWKRNKGKMEKKTDGEYILMKMAPKKSKNRSEILHSWISNIHFE